MLGPTFPSLARSRAPQRQGRSLSLLLSLSRGLSLSLSRGLSLSLSLGLYVGTTTSADASVTPGSDKNVSPDPTLPVGPELLPDHTTSARDLAADAFEAGRDAFDAGRFDEAIAHFERAQSYVPHADTQYNLGMAQLRNGQQLKAWTTFDELAREAKNTDVQQDALARRHELESELALLRIMTASQVKICVGDQHVPATQDARPIALQPGVHRVWIEGHAIELQLEAGELRVVQHEGRIRLPDAARPAILGLLGVGVGSSALAAGLAGGSALSDDTVPRKALAWGAASAAVLGLASSATALALHHRAKRRAARPKDASRDPCAQENARP